MGVPDVLCVQEVQDLGTSGAVGAAPQTIAGNVFDLRNAERGSLSALLTGQAKTNTLTMTAKWQVKDRAGSWHDVAAISNNPANVALATGTGSAVSFDVVIPAPDAVYAFKSARLVVVTGVAAATAADDKVTKLAYNYRRPSF